MTVEDDSRGAGHGTGGRGVESDTALHPDRQVNPGYQPLEQDKRGFLSHPATRFVPLRDQRINPSRLARFGLAQAGDDQVGPAAMRMDGLDLPAESLQGATGEDNHVEARGRLCEHEVEEFLCLCVQGNADPSPSKCGQVG